MTLLTSAGSSLCISVGFAVLYLEAFLNMGKYIGNSLGLHELLFFFLYREFFFCREVITAQHFFFLFVRVYENPENFGHAV